MRKILILAAAAAALILQSAASTFEEVTVFDRSNPLNKILFRHWQSKGITLLRPASDAVFIRRVMLTAAGRLPNADEARNFILDGDPAKRSKLIEKVLFSPEYADMQTMRFADMLRIKSEFPINLWPNAVQLYHRKIHDDLAADRSLAAMFYEMLTASGSNFRTPYANFFRASADRSPAGLAKMVLLTTMGMRENFMSEAELKSFSMLFSRIRYKSTFEWKEEIVFNDYLPAKISAILPDGSRVTVDDSAGNDPRKLFADWLLDRDNPYFSRAVTNRVWHWVFGRGIYPVADDLPQIPGFWAGLFGKKPVSEPFSREVQNYLDTEFKKSNYSLRHLYRVIMNSAAFQVSSLNADEEKSANFAVYPVRRLESELLIDALASVTGGYDSYMSVIPEPFTYLPRRTKAVNIADGSISTGVLDSFGRPPRDSGQFSERNGASSDSQNLYLMNSTALYRRITNYNKQLDRRYRNDRDRLERTYLDILSRFPTERERAAFRKYSKTPDKKSYRMRWDDTVWILLNSKEFLFYH
ncbi:MAG: DUF1553 domain-containing protein [Lentisphaeria bacterium]|nr:DUF1553 domain-containing protein [Lentisphaeria bacterium]